jgi:hypothetical protein
VPGTITVVGCDGIIWTFFTEHSTHLWWQRMSQQYNRRLLSVEPAWCSMNMLPVTYVPILGLKPETHMLCKHNPRNAVRNFPREILFFYGVCGFLLDCKCSRPIAACTNINPSIPGWRIRCLTFIVFYFCTFLQNTLKRFNFNSDVLVMFLSHYMHDTCRD